MKEFLSEVLRLLSEVPAAFWGVVAGSFFTLLGVWRTNLAQDRRAAVEREMSLRREIYLGAADAISESMAYIGQLSDFSKTPEAAASNYVAKVSALARTNIVSSKETSIALNRYSTSHTTHIFTLLAERIPVAAAANAATAALERRVAADREIEALSAQLTAHTISGGETKVIQGLLVAAVRRRDEQAAEYSRLLSESMPRQLAFARTCAVAAGTLRPLIVELIAAVRRELNLSYDLEANLRIAQDAQAAQQANFDRLIDHLTTQIAELSQPAREAKLEGIPASGPKLPAG